MGFLNIEELQRERNLTRPIAYHKSPIFIVVLIINLIIILKIPSGYETNIESISRNLEVKGILKEPARTRE